MWFDEQAPRPGRRAAIKFVALINRKQNTAMKVHLNIKYLIIIILKKCFAREFVCTPKYCYRQLGHNGLSHVID